MSLPASISIILLVSAFFQFIRWRCKNVSIQVRTEFDSNNNKNIEYSPTKPDFWRWFEYACTSPIQIMLISASLLILNWTLLLALSSLQFSLIWFGFVLEKRINKLYRSERQLSKTKCSKPIILLLSAWLCFGVIWGIILWKLRKNDSNPRSLLDKTFTKTWNSTKCFMCDQRV